MSFVFDSDGDWQQWIENRPPEFFVYELGVFRTAIHLMARDIADGKQRLSYVFSDEQSIVNHYIAQARTGRRS